MGAQSLGTTGCSDVASQGRDVPCRLTAVFAVWARPYHRLNPDYERLKTQCVRAMSDLQSLQSQHTNALKRCEEVAKETDFYQ